MSALVLSLPPTLGEIARIGLGETAPHGAVGHGERSVGRCTYFYAFGSAVTFRRCVRLVRRGTRGDEHKRRTTASRTLRAQHLSVNLLNFVLFRVVPF